MSKGTIFQMPLVDVPYIVVRFSYFLRVGLIHTLFIFQVTWREEDRRIDRCTLIPRVDRVSAVHGSRSTHVRDKKSYNG